jgi:hypothetical protein
VSEDWPSPQHAERSPLPRLEDLPRAEHGYDPERVEEAFDAFYRHLAQLDSTLRTLETVDAFSRQAAELRADLRSIRAAGWSPYPRGYAVSAPAPRGGGIPPAVPRIALEVVFLIAVAVAVAVAGFSVVEIVVVMAAAFAIAASVELIAARDRPRTLRPSAPSVAATAPAPVADAEPSAESPPAPAVALPAAAPVAADEGERGWAAFAEPSGPEALTVMEALSYGDEVAAPLELEAAAAPPAESTAEFTLDEAEALAAKPEVADAEPLDTPALFVEQAPGLEDMSAEPVAEPVEAVSGSEPQAPAESWPEGEVAPADAVPRSEPQSLEEPLVDEDVAAAEVAASEPLAPAAPAGRRRWFRRRAAPEPDAVPTDEALAAGLAAAEVADEPAVGATSEPEADVQPAAGEPERDSTPEAAAGEPVAVEHEPEPEAEPDADSAPEPEPAAVAVAAVEASTPDTAERATVDEDTAERKRPRWGWRRRRREPDSDEGQAEREPPKHVRVLPPPEPVLQQDLDPWERGFDYDLEAPEAERDEEELPVRRTQR